MKRAKVAVAAALGALVFAVPVGSAQATHTRGSDDNASCVAQDVALLPPEVRGEIISNAAQTFQPEQQAERFVELFGGTDAARGLEAVVVRAGPALRGAVRPAYPLGVGRVGGPA